MIIGEAPGSTENKTGIPFVGNSGQLLRELLRNLLINPKEVWITNVVKCKPPNNRTPTDIEVANCAPYIFIEIMKVKPRVILLLGGTVTKLFYGRSMFTMGRYRGKLAIVDNTIILSTYHPSYILRNKNDNKIISTFIKDMKLFKELVKMIR
jgi:uracil-DNA glycosylase family 4